MDIKDRPHDNMCTKAHKDWKMAAKGLPSRKVIRPDGTKENMDSSEVAGVLVRYMCPYCYEKNVWIPMEYYEGMQIKNSFLFQVSGSPFFWHKDVFPFPIVGLTPPQLGVLSKQRFHMRKHVKKCHGDIEEKDYPLAFAMKTTPSGIEFKGDRVMYSRLLKRKQRKDTTKDVKKGVPLKTSEAVRLAGDRIRSKCHYRGRGEHVKVKVQAKRAKLTIENPTFDDEEDAEVVAEYNRYVTGKSYDTL